jgi:hypothetical protein
MIESPAIQSYITSTAKLREMIGGSQIISELTADFFDNIIQEMNLEECHKPNTGNKWYLVIQRAAATIRIVFPDKAIAKALLKRYSLAVKKSYPGIQILGAVVEFAWDFSSYESLHKAGQNATRKIGKKRVQQPANTGLSLLPFCQVAPLDAKPGIRVNSKEELLSQASDTRDRFATAGNNNLTRQFNEDLKKAIQKEHGTEKEIKLNWALDYDQMFRERRTHSYLGILHMDGNDLGKIIENKLDLQQKTSNCNVLQEMRNFSENLDKWNRSAFQQALNRVVLLDLQHDSTLPDEYVIPVRPLVIGGDDLTVAIRADLALTFAAVYADEITRASKNENENEIITVGAGMVICNHHYPFARAYSLVEELTSSAKEYSKKNRDIISGIDFLVLTSEMEDRLSTIRKRLYTNANNEKLTSKPYTLSEKNVDKFHTRVKKMHTELPVSAIRRAVDACRRGKEQSDLHHLEMRENIRRKLGGRHNCKLMEETDFLAMFSSDSYFKQNRTTDLLDLHEMTRFIQEEY